MAEVRNELINNITTVDQLKKYTKLSEEQEQAILHIIKKHPMGITQYYLSLINWDDPDDPIRKIVIPSEEELDPQGSYDTSGESEHTILPGLQHKYIKTVLLLVTNRCASFCRHCFRRRMVGVSSEEVLVDEKAAIRYISEHSEISNVLVSGGDPLLLPIEKLQELILDLSKIDHLSYIRIGTRIPVTLPDFITSNITLVDMLKSCSEKKQIHIVTHFNHPRELTKASKEAVQTLLSIRIPVHNQTVFLRGINSDPSILEHLMRGLTTIGINPYYLFQCRSVKGIKNHFQVPLLLGYRIVEEAKRRLSGLSKRFRYVMSHTTGKIEIVNVAHDHIHFKYHQARDPEKTGTFFERPIKANAGWLDDLE